MPQTAHSFDTGRGLRGRLNYLLHLPRDYGARSARRWPMIFFLHGAGERGGDPNLLKRHGIPRIVARRPDFPFIAVSPQCAAGSWWQYYMRTLSALLDDVTARLAVDYDRVYVTGMSMGGYGTWQLACDNPDRFAAVAPICGYGLASKGFPDRVCALKDVPVWAFHGARDDVVPVADSIVLVDRLRACGGDVRFTVYPDLAHNSWTRTYANPELYTWLLGHSRNGPPPS